MPFDENLLARVLGTQKEIKPERANFQVKQKNLCSLYDVVTILQKKYSFTKYDFGNLKAWFNIADLIKNAEERDLLLSEMQAKDFLSRLVKGRFLTTREGVKGMEYHRCDIFLQGWEARLV